VATIPESEEIELLVSYNTICERQRHALRLFVGRGKRFSTEELSLGSGVKEKRIHAAIRPVTADDYRLLRHEEFASIAKFLTGEGLGAAFISACIEPCGLGAFELMDGQPPLPRTLDPCKQPAKLSREDHIRKAREHLLAAETAE
jgi:hypothetical protein